MFCKLYPFRVAQQVTSYVAIIANGRNSFSTHDHGELGIMF